MPGGLAERVMRLDQKIRVVVLLGQDEESLRQLPGAFELRLYLVDFPEPAQRPKQLRLVSGSVTELEASSESVLHLARPPALRHRLRHAEGKLEVELSLGALGSVGQAQQQPDGVRQMADRLRARGQP